MSEERPYKTALVIGAGAFGTSIASVLANNFEKVILKVRSEDVFEGIDKDHENTVYLPGTKLPTNIRAALDWEEVDKEDENIELIVSGLPTSAIKKYYQKIPERTEAYLERDIPFVSLSKGIDPETLELADDLFFDLFPNHRENFFRPVFCPRNHSRANYPRDPRWALKKES